MMQTNHLPDTVEDMLLDAGYGKDPQLRAALLALGSLASLPAPAPSGSLAVLLTEPGTSTGESDAIGGLTESGPDELAGRRRLRAHRPTVVGLALIAGMGLGVGGVAASSAVPGRSGSPSIQHLLEDWTPAWSLPARDVPLSRPSLDDVDGLDPDAAVHGAPEPGATGATEEIATTGGGTPAAAPAADDASAARRTPEIPAPNIPGQGKQGNGEGQRGGKDAATESGKPGAAAARDEKETPVGGLPEQAVGQGGAGAPDEEANHVAGAAPGAGPGSVPEVLRQGVDAAGAAAHAVPGAKWLQKFSR
ncbi:hypothetical protein M1D93_03560 [Arthrobacter sp. Z1-9]